jgi:phosphoenolpyruvate synthase/pyruvate phosphate dikinase
MYCKKLADLDENEEKIVGGKAWNLSLLLKQHVPAPGGINYLAFNRMINAPTNIRNLFEN